MGAGVIVEVVGDFGQGVDEGLVGGFFGVEHAQGIGFGAALIVFAELVLDGREGFTEGGVVVFAVFGGADGVELELPVLDAQLVQQRGQHFEDLGVADGRFGAGSAGPRTSTPICQNWR